MSTCSITFDEKRFGYLLDLFKSLKISVREVKDEEKEDEYVPRTAEQLEADLISAMKSVKLHREGKIKLKSFKEVLDELPD